MLLSVILHEEMAKQLREMKASLACFWSRSAFFGDVGGRPSPQLITSCELSLPPCKVLCMLK